MSILFQFNRLSPQLLLTNSTRLQPMIYLFSGGADSKARHSASTEHTPAICFFPRYEWNTYSRAALQSSRLTPHCRQKELGKSQPWSEPFPRFPNSEDQKSKEG